MLNVICVNKNDYLGRGDEYVDALREGVARNLRYPYKFHVLTDVPGDGWWSKLAMFQPGRFTGRCLYFDLDTVIVDSIDHVSKYCGDFAMLTDFYHPEHLQSSVMMWEAGKADHIWTRWDVLGRPEFDPRGDQAWIESLMPKADRLQTLYPGQFVSFKVHCIDGVPQGARVVCFHGLPRPHVLSDLLEHW